MVQVKQIAEAVRSLAGPAGGNLDGRHSLLGLGYKLCAMRKTQKQRRRPRQWRGRSVILPLLLMSKSFTCEGSGGLRNHETTLEGGHMDIGEGRGPLDQDMPDADELTATITRREELLSSEFPGENDQPVNRLSATTEHSLSPELERRNLHNKGKVKQDKKKGKKKKNKKAQKKNGKLGKMKAKPLLQKKAKPQQMKAKPQQLKAQQKNKRCDANAQRLCCKRANQENFWTFCSNRGCDANRCPQYKNDPMVQWAVANGVELPGGFSKGKGCKCSAKPYNAAATYSAHDKVEAGCDIYKCKDAPFDLWCKNVAYAPTTQHGEMAWALVKSCQE